MMTPEECLGWLREETLPLIRELCDDLQRVYDPEKGWPPHIARAMDLRDEEEVLGQLETHLGLHND